MWRSKSRSEAHVEIRGKNDGDRRRRRRHSSVFSRTFSASSFCRGDSIGAQIDPTALVKSNNNKSFRDSKPNLFENPIVIETMDDELRRAMSEKERLVEELKEVKKELAESRKVEDLTDEIKSLKKSLSEKDKTIESLEMDLERLSENEEIIKRLKEELKDREKEAKTIETENKRRIKELEGEVMRWRESESRVGKSLSSKVRELDAIEFELQEAKIEIASLYEKIGTLESLCDHDGGDDNDNLAPELKVAREREKSTISRMEAMQDEMDLLKHEWKKALDAEQKSAKAMDDLVMALTEVAAEAKQSKEKLAAAEVEIERSTTRVELLKCALEEARREVDVHRNTVDRLKFEVEESLMAWNGKEMGFVTCIKRAEEEKAIALHETARMEEALKIAENSTKTAKDEMYRSRDLLKQALNEANAAKAAAAIARDENSQLKDALVEKESTIHFLTEENERLRINEAAAQESVEQLKRMLSSSSSAEMKFDSKDMHDGPPDSDGSEYENDHDRKNDDGHSSEGFTLNLDALKLLTEPEDFNLRILDDDPDKAEALKGSIFDTNAETPKSEPHTPKRKFPNQRQRRYSFSYAEIQERQNSTETFFNNEYDDTNLQNKNTQHRRVKTMFRRVGGLLAIKKGSSHRKESQLPSPSRSQSSIE
ncbi:putative WEB family protein At1g65010, chloroplastic [Andrographis paniculata]|uniref:putative WEB family protein At1g65010, chloroplastic n=1 Tax=Andrographis paniculata TaxID=175694 RepID=UPI0021E87FF2|nr:putative WEB family protein At1g65010, chloroplastic [Andrographis paniculata]